jgi:hypothetical protein
VGFAEGMDAEKVAEGGRHGRECRRCGAGAKCEFRIRQPRGGICMGIV